MAHIDACERAKSGLTKALERATPGLAPLDAGYVPEFGDNLLDGIDHVWFVNELLQGRGNELKRKFRAAYSSSALAVNTFAPFKMRPTLLRIGDQSGFESMHFEAKCPIFPDHVRRTPPHLDLLAFGPNAIVGVESKCTEHLNPHVARFASTYIDHVPDHIRPSAWFATMKGLIAQPSQYRHLDAAQLVKHAFGLAACYAQRPIVLLYLYWEPTNADDMPEFANHREEVTRFAAALGGANPSFKAQSYRALWRQWEELREPEWLPEHLRRVRARYEIAI